MLQQAGMHVNTLGTLVTALTYSATRFYFANTGHLHAWTHTCRESDRQENQRDRETEVFRTMFAEGGEKDTQVVPHGCYPASITHSSGRDGMIAQLQF